VCVACHYGVNICQKEGIYAMLNERFEIIETLSGEKSIKDSLVQERLHPAGPLYESQEIYIAQSRIKEKLSDMTRSCPLVLYDVGLGAAANGIAAVEAAYEVCGHKLKILSFENDLEIFRFTLKNISSFPHLMKHEVLLNTLLENLFYNDQWIEWEIMHGSFLDFIKLDLAPPEIIFHDMYSPSKHRDLWDPQIFKRYFELARGGECTFVTYSQATWIRCGLRDAGFFVGHGKGLGMKRESTVASTNLKEIEKRWGQPF
jgi:hypothetical protein